MGVLRNQRSTSKNHPAARGHRRTRLQRQVRKKKHGARVGDVADAAIMPKSILKKRRTSPKANITLSGKKKHKILRQIRRTTREKNAMETITETPEAAPEATEEVKMVASPEPKKKSKKRGKGKKSVVKDVEMMDEDC